MNANDVAIEAYLRELGADADWIEAKVGAQDDPTAIANKLGISASTARLGVRRLTASGRLEVAESNGRRPARYRLLQPADQPADNPPNPPTQPADSNPPTAALPSRGRAEGLPSPPTSRPPTSAPVACPAEPAEPDDPPTRRPADPTTEGVDVGQAVVGWAVDEQRRLGKATLDGALLGRIGSVAKRMFDDGRGVAPVDLKLAAETLVQRDMTDLQAAHRKAQSGAGSVLSTRASGDAMERLAVEAEASRTIRDRYHLGSQVEHMVEVWWFLAWQWGRVYGEAERAEWTEALRPFPIDAILAALRELSRSGEHKRWPPTCGEVYRVTLPLVLDARRQRAHRDLHAE